MSSSIKNLTSTIKAMLAAGCTQDQINAVLDVHAKEEEERLETKRQKERDKKRRQRALSRDVPRDNVGHLGTVGDTGDTSPSSSSSNGFPPSDIVKLYTPPSLTPSSSPSHVYSRKQRGTRLSPDWVPKEHADQTYELDKFRDHFLSVAGEKGVKLDWDATWRNWIRRAQERPKSTITKQETVAERTQRLLKECDDEQKEGNSGNSNSLLDLWAKQSRP